MAAIRVSVKPAYQHHSPAAEAITLPRGCGRRFRHQKDTEGRVGNKGGLGFLKSMK